jgi:2'-5' RNA ligase
LSDPIIVTALFDEETQSKLDQLRRDWFPPKLNVIPAHITLFHKLPAGCGDALREEAARFCSEHTPSEVAFEAVVALGQGTAIRAASPALKAIRDGLAKAFREELSQQDRQGFRPHVTVQNKVTAKTAEACRQVIEEGFEPFTACLKGVTLWRYKGGPWERIADVTGQD